MAGYYLAVDLGASGGRHILARREGAEMVLQEIHRFPNAPVQRGGVLVWDTEALFAEIIAGLKKCAALGTIPRSVALDSWAVDYVLRTGAGQDIAPCYAYRDGASARYAATGAAFKKMYAVTGTANLPFLTAYQLLRDKAEGRLERATAFFMLPDYFAGRLGGRWDMAAEYTNATSTGLVDARARDWARPLIGELGLPPRLFREIRRPPYSAGFFSAEVAAACGFSAEIIVVASHDTASAVSTLPPDAAYISSGTWSLFGCRSGPVTGDAAREKNWTNEGDTGGRVRFLKVITGLWILQNLRRELGIAFTGLEAAAREAAACDEPASAPGGDALVFDVDGECFVNPPSMAQAINAELARLGKKPASGAGELALGAYKSLARAYGTASQELEELSGRTWDTLNIIGGGSRDAFLNELAARATGKKIQTGAAEASALGNVLLQEQYYQENAA